ncbi:uncharacterized protein LOC133711298 [Rosa rugosa]|uniref:uncharacterized protein LOC133711298 n=1 Tax=Rosa rugosa TaxID=74645 RepID=UPI002B4141E5|nr:uncharacterized protein LOC133711298 [Rosa rugosa]
MATTPIQVSASSSSPIIGKVPLFSAPYCAMFDGLVGERVDEKKGAGFSGIVGADDLLIVGPGLGSTWAISCREMAGVVKQLSFDRSIRVVGHEELIKVGIKMDHKFPNVIFCAPPSRTSDYPDDHLFFLVYIKLCNDNSPSVADRGAHVYWLSKGTVEANPNHVLNLIHYEDTASLSVAILKKRLRNRILLGCDNHPLSRKEVIDLVNKSGKFTKVFESFTGTTDPLGKRLNNSKTCAEIGWEPKYPSFSQFLESLNKW